MHEGGIEGIGGGDWNGRLRVWNAETLAEERTMEGHNRAVLALVAWGGSMVSGCADGGVKVWDGATGQCLGALEGGHVGGVNALLVRSMSHIKELLLKFLLHPSYGKDLMSSYGILVRIVRNGKLRLHQN